MLTIPTHTVHSLVVTLAMDSVGTRISLHDEFMFPRISGEYRSRVTVLDVPDTSSIVKGQRRETSYIPYVKHVYSVNLQLSADAYYRPKMYRISAS